MIYRRKATDISTKEKAISSSPPNNSAKRVAITIDLKFALPWHQDCYQGIMRYAEQHGWRCTLDLYVAGIGTESPKAIYDGVIGRISDDVADRIQPLGIPMSNLRTYVAAGHIPRHRELPGVYIDRDEAIRMAVKHLAQNGYPRVAALPLMQDDEDHVLQVVDAACAQEAIESVTSYGFPGDYADSLDKHIDMLQKMREWLNQLAKPVGLMAIHPNLSRFVAHACLELNLRIPEDVGIITPTGDQIVTTSGSPTISAVEFDYYKQGYEAAALLDKLMQGQEVHPFRKVIAPVELVVRDSTDVFLCEDELVSRAMRHIAAHTKSDLSVNTLAQAMGVSRRTLHRKFEEAINSTPQHEINRLRIDYLKRLLSETDQSIAQICDLCEFSNPSHLARYFKRLAGETPSQYRRRRQAKSNY